MTRNSVRQAAREAIIGPACGNDPKGRRDTPRDRTGTRGIGSVLRHLHGSIAEEPLPPKLAGLLDALSRAEKR